MAQMFDEAELMERVDNDVEFLAETVEMLASDGPTLVEQIRAGIVSGDAPAVGRHAHALKGMISNFCAPETQAAALELEKLGKAGDLSNATGALDDLARRVADLTTELTEFVRSRA